MDRSTYGTALLAVAVLLFVGTLAVSAATAPTRGVDASGDAPRTLVGSHGGGPGWHEYGSVYLLEGDDVVWREGSADSYFDVTMRENGTVLAGFMDSGYRSGCGPYDPPCAKTGFRIIDPDAEGGPAVVEEFAFPVRTAKNSESHDVEEIEPGTFLVSDMEHERIFTVRDGEITWQWNASSFYNPPADPTRRDWLHLNDVDAINDTHYLVSIRNANQIVLVERGAGVVRVINEDTNDGNDASCRGNDQLVPDENGDVRCGDPAVLDHQHNPQWLSDGAVLVADSENDRVVELHRDEATGEWEPAWTLSRAGAIELHWPRDADRLTNGNTLVTDTLNKRVFEVTANGTVVWSARTKRIPYEAERLPEGERVGARRYSSNGHVAAAAGDVPVLSTGVVALQAVLPWIPIWFRELQLGLTVLAVALAAIGAVVQLRTER